MKIPSILEMLQAGAHFGHQISRWHPKMKPYIFTERNGVHVIDLEQTQAKLKEVLEAVKKFVQEGKIILFVSTKPQAKEIVKQAAIACGMPYLTERWLGGMLTNFNEIKKLIKKYNTLKAEQASGELEKYTKKEQAQFAKELGKMDTFLCGLADLEKMPDLVFLPSMQKEKTALLEANRMRVPVVAVCDTNSNPTKAEYFIPANDDAVNAIKMIAGLMAEAVKEGRSEWEKNKSNEKTVNSKQELNKKI